MSLPLPTENSLLKYEASDEVQALIDQIGRTEDIILSPDQTRLALAAFLECKIYFLDIDFASPPIRIHGVKVLASDRLKDPHGIAFLGNDHVAVCNRAADVCIFQVADASASGRSVAPVATINSKGLFGSKVRTPGSITAYEMAENKYRVFVSNDQWHFVSAHQISLASSIAIEHEGVLLENGLQIPDGVSISADHRWIAVSNNTDGEVLLYENLPGLNRTTPPVAKLQGVVCPHGLDWDGEGNLFVADAASPYLHVFDKPAEGWEGQTVSSRPILLMDRNVFYKGRFASREGGIKGLHVNKAARVLMTTHQHGTLDFYDLTLLRASPSELDQEELEAMRAGRDQEMSGSAVLFSRKWSLTQRTRAQLGRIKIELIQFPKRFSAVLKRFQLIRANQFSKTPITNSAESVAVSISTQANRVSRVHLAIESIARGLRKPGKFILWISGQAEISSSLKRLQSRGLDIRVCDDFGPHTKYYPYLESMNGTGAEMLVTADDDVVYPPEWLDRLLTAHRDHPEAIHCFDARRIGINKYHFDPCQFWDICPTSDPDRLNFLFTGHGVLYPHSFLSRVQARGTGFQTVAPDSDAVWMSHIAFREGIPIASVAGQGLVFESIPKSETYDLPKIQFIYGGSQVQLAQTFDKEDRKQLFDLQSA